MQRNDSGIALISTMLIMMLMSALLLGFVALVTTDQRAGFATRDQTTAYSAAHAGLEQLTSDLGELFAQNFAPTGAQINGLVTAPPALPGVQFLAPDLSPGYTIAFNADAQGNPMSEPTPRTITAGPFQGFLGLITPYTITVTARTGAGGEVRTRREMQTVAIPVFQFGMFSENDLSFFPGPNFSFGGRVHSNANVFLAADGGTLTLSDRVTVVGDVIRTNLSNGYPTSANYSTTVNVIRAPGVFRALARTEGSLIGTLGSAVNEPTWTNLSVGTYNGYIKNGRTGARRLDLPLVQMGALPIDLIRRPAQNSAEDVNNAPVFGQRYYSMASLRVLISDTAADLTSLPTITGGAPVALTAAGLASFGYTVDPSHPPIAESSGAAPHLTPVNTPLLDGFIKIERQDRNGVWSDVTMEFLNLGIAGRNISRGVLNAPDNGTCSALGEPNPNAIVRLQRLRDTPAAGAMSGGVRCGNGSTLATDYWPNVIYDAREGVYRDVAPIVNPGNPRLGGVMHYVELDVNNLRQWFAGNIGASGPGSMDVTGYVVYFSDRRLNRNLMNQETGEFGWEDFVNSDSVSTPNGMLDTGEDMNGNGVLDVYGGVPQPVAGATAPFDLTARLWTDVSAVQARANRAVFYRRALKLVNGQRGNLPSVNNQGLTVVSENAVYIQGNYNADGAGFGATGDGHVSAAVIADAVTFLSNSWNDIVSLTQPHVADNRNATTTWYRAAIVSGKGISFPQPGTAGGPTANAGDHRDMGTDGGAHNFLRFVEDWGGQTLNYRGSIVSFYTSRQGIGTYKCCDVVYRPPSRGYNFDVEFLTPALLPPRTPMFRDVNTLTFRQILRPTQ